MSLKASLKQFLKRLYRAFFPTPPPDPFVRMDPRMIYSKKYSFQIDDGHSIDPGLQTKPTFLLTDSAIGNDAIREKSKVIKSIDEVLVDEIKRSIFYVYFQCDSDALYHVRKIIAHGGTFFPPLAFDKTEYRFVDRAALETLKKTWAKNDQLSHLVVNVHENICEALHLTRDLEGDFLEVGVFRGSSAHTALTYLQTIGVRRKAWLLDTFDGFNYEEAKSSSDAIWTGTHKLFGAEETKRRIGEILQDTGQSFQLVQSNICADALPTEAVRLAVANIDVDLYEATLAALIKIAPRIVPGGIMICEDPTSTPGLYGAYVAMHEFLESNEGGAFFPVFKGGQYFLIRKT